MRTLEECREEKLRLALDSIRARVSAGEHDGWPRKFDTLLTKAIEGVTGKKGIDLPALSDTARHVGKMVRNYSELVILAQMYGTARGEECADIICFLGLWAQSGCPVLELSKAQAAEIALTDAPESVVRETMPPWDAFVIKIDGGLASTKDGTIKIVQCWHQSEPSVHEEPLWSVTAHVSGMILSRYRCTASVLADYETRQRDRDHTAFRGGVPIDNDDARAISLLGRLMIGSCLAIHERGGSKRVIGGKSRKARELASKLSVHTLDRPVIVDFSQSVQEYVSGTGFARKSRWVVRGHWRNQPVGAGRSERKVTWVRPHWCGPTGGAELRREYRIAE